MKTFLLGALTMTGFACAANAESPKNYLPPYKASHYPLATRAPERLTSEADAAVLGRHLTLVEFGFPVNAPNGKVVPRVDANFRACLDQQRGEVRRLVQLLKQPKNNYVRYLLDSGFGFHGEINIAPEGLVADYRGLKIAPFQPASQIEEDAEYIRTGEYPKLRKNTQILGNAKLNVRVRAKDGKCYGARAEEMLFHLSLVANCVTKKGAARCGSPDYSMESNVPEPHPAGMILGH